jgi:hypothetical protein
MYVVLDDLDLPGVLMMRAFVLTVAVLGATPAAARSPECVALRALSLDFLRLSANVHGQAGLLLMQAVGAEVTGDLSPDASRALSEASGPIMDLAVDAADKHDEWVARIDAMCPR